MPPTMLSMEEGCRRPMLNKTFDFIGLRVPKKQIIVRTSYLFNTVLNKEEPGALTKPDL